VNVHDDRARHRAGSALVAAQFGLLAALFGLMEVRGFDPSAGAMLLVVLSAALVAWTLLHNRLGNFNIHPQPHAKGELVTSGPYRWIRHPMYTAVLLGAAALATASEVGLAWALWLGLLGVLWTKALLEERWLTQRYPPYASYCQRSKRFIPWVL